MPRKTARASPACLRRFTAIALPARRARDRKAPPLTVLTTPAPGPAGNLINPAPGERYQFEGPWRRRFRSTRRPRRAAAESEPMIASVRPPGLRIVAELTSSSLIDSTSPRRHAARNTNNATNSATACPPPESTKTPKTNASPASPNHGKELVFSFLSSINPHMRSATGSPCADVVISVPPSRLLRVNSSTAVESHRLDTVSVRRAGVLTFGNGTRRVRVAAPLGPRRSSRVC